jgi:hypothetical protein
MRGIPVLTVLGLLLAGCANSIESMMITADTALISAVGSNAGDKARLIDASLQEAARVTRQHGYRYFVVLDAADASKTGRRIVVTSRVRQEKINDNPYGSSNLPSLTNVYGTFPPTGRSVSYVKPGLDITIRMYRDGAIDPKGEGVWNSDDLPARTANAR